MSSSVVKGTASTYVMLQKILRKLSGEEVELASPSQIRPRKGNANLASSVLCRLLARPIPIVLGRGVEHVEIHLSPWRDF